MSVPLHHDESPERQSCPLDHATSCHIWYYIMVVWLWQPWEFLAEVESFWFSYHSMADILGDSWNFMHHKILCVSSTINNNYYCVSCSGSHVPHLQKDPSTSQESTTGTERWVICEMKSILFIHVTWLFSASAIRQKLSSRVIISKQCSHGDQLQPSESVKEAATVNEVTTGGKSLPGRGQPTKFLLHQVLSG